MEDNLDKEAKFMVKWYSKITVQGKATIAAGVKIDDYTVPDVYTITETQAPNKYCKFNGTIKVIVAKESSWWRIQIDKK